MKDKIEENNSWTLWFNK